MFAGGADWADKFATGSPRGVQLLGAAAPLCLSALSSISGLLYVSTAASSASLSCSTAAIVRFTQPAFQHEVHAPQPRSGLRRRSSRELVCRNRAAYRRHAVRAAKHAGAGLRPLAAPPREADGAAAGGRCALQSLILVVQASQTRLAPRGAQVVTTLGGGPKEETPVGTPGTATLTLQTWLNTYNPDVSPRRCAPASAVFAPGGGRARCPCARARCAGIVQHPSSQRLESRAAAANAGSVSRVRSLSACSRRMLAVLGCDWGQGLAKSKN